MNLTGIGAAGAEKKSMFICEDLPGAPYLTVRLTNQEFRSKGYFV